MKQAGDIVYAVTANGAALSIWTTRGDADRESLRLKTSREVKVLAPEAKFAVVNYRLQDLG